MSRLCLLTKGWAFAAEEINDLYASRADGLFVTLKEEGFLPKREFEIWEGGAAHMVDLTIPCREGTIAIAVTDRPAPPDALCNPDLDAVCGAIERLGGPRPTQVGLQKGLRTVE
jgi:hypothetical protein